MDKRISTVIGLWVLVAAPLICHAIRSLNRALAINPNYSEAEQWLSFVRRESEWLDAARRELEAAPVPIDDFYMPDWIPRSLLGPRTPPPVGDFETEHERLMREGREGPELLAPL
jgi:hypothetical protein